MCVQSVNRLKCGHYEHHAWTTCSTKLGKQCEKYKAELAKVSKSRSCAACKLIRAASLGVASPGLGLLKF